jgi:hypothetical protein
MAHCGRDRSTGDAYTSMTLDPNFGRGGGTNAEITRQEIGQTTGTALRDQLMIKNPKLLFYSKFMSLYNLFQQSRKRLEG